MRVVRVRCRHFQSTIDSQVAYIIFRLWDEYESSSGVGGLCAGENTSARLCAKKARGAYARGGRICGTLRYNRLGFVTFTTPGTPPRDLVHIHTQNLVLQT